MDAELLASGDIVPEVYEEMMRLRGMQAFTSETTFRLMQIAELNVWRQQQSNPRFANNLTFSSN